MRTADENGKAGIASRSGKEKELVVCFTGHRRIDAQEALRLPAALDAVIRELYDRGARVFRAGGAMGFDTVAALKVLEVKKEFPNIRLELFLPCRDQTRKWYLYDRLVYARILRRADRTEYASDSYTPYCMLARDRELVTGSDVCVAYLKKPTGGTAYTVQYAESVGVRVVRLANVGQDA